MHINQLVDILKFINTIIDKNNLPSDYQELHTLCSQKHVSDAGSMKDRLFEAKKKLANKLIEINPKSWTDAQQRIFYKFDKPDVFGEEAVRLLHKLFDEENFDPLFVKKEIENIISSLLQIKKSAAQLLEGLEPLVKPGSRGLGGELEIEERHHLLYIQFDEGIFIKNIGQLEKFCRIWNRILASFAYLTQETIDDIRIYDIESSSITFYTGIKTINALTKGTYQVLKGYKKVLDVRKIQLELEDLNLSNKEDIKNLLEEEVINIVDVISSSVTKELLTKYGWNEKFEHEDVYKAVQVSLKQAINFVEKGGKIDSNHAGDLRQMNENVISTLKRISEMEHEKKNNENESLNISVETIF
ncbi:MAG: hypothetical protein A2275_05455 [Bacteroidetes bacterium RIFOXYA12_FULL_35_11]|nr:MAG: hypothetical protein A2X01_10675 [Bacteroidetes bacterium GWF2_35_48]OFY73835.1 MAG: hypothetical protein A2275_05455 [Bacteroidetes bacterium RIFOXYA12_FULL_35_11]OFY93105.1 MAG: hypothetical protein A2309_13430 [Bacteroidetes bacterium RIFOXYB2_FULL_35_7]OFZ03189.1 MAG: hypothetical protein A2491_18385 [Bacteroidetes bacterium RIFOXYC12_FULL_35_7]